MERVANFFLNLKPIRFVIEWSKVFILPGFSPLPLYTVLSFFFQEIGKDSIDNKASSLAYNFMLAVFPAIIFLFTLIPYIPITNFQDELLSLLSSVLPSNAYKAVQATLTDIVKNQNGKLLSVGFILALIFATNGVHNLMNAFNKSSLIVETRSWLMQRFVAINLTLLIALALIFGIGIIVASEFILNFIRSTLNLKQGTFWVFMVGTLKWFITVSIYFITTSLLYRYGPANSKKWRFFSAGSWLATILAVLTSVLFAFYINNFGTYNKIYGSIGTLLVIMIWLYLNSFIILLGFEFNASIDLSKRSIKIVKPRFNSFKQS